jgi:hypothetical protein
VPDNGDQIPVPAGLDLQHAKTILDIMERHPLDGPRQNLTGRLLGPVWLCHDLFFAF